jgi:hypothetical protein
MHLQNRIADKGSTGLVVLLVVGFVALFGVVGYVMGWFGEAASVTQEQFGPRAALKKYEWFVDQANRIKKMDADVALFQERAANVDTAYAAYGAKETWAPDVRMQYQSERKQAQDDLTAIVSQRNTLVNEYNAASEKFNWSPFNSKDDLPPPKFETSTAK